MRAAGVSKEFHMEGLTLVVLLLTFCATASLAFTSIAAVWIESPRPSNNSNAGRWSYKF
jgi:hypothetical protein